MRENNFFLDILETVLSSLIVIFVIYMTIAVPEQVSGSSMEPNFYTGERILVEKISKHFKDFERGEVVVLNPPGNDNVDYIKRIVGIPGDIVKVMDCSIYISRDGKKFKLDENYLLQGTCTEGGPDLKDGRSLKIENGLFLVMGDNRDNSADSRFFGLVEQKRIVGRAVFRFWPLSKIGFI